MWIYNYKSETYIILLTNVTPINLIKKFKDNKIKFWKEVYVENASSH